MVEAVAVVGRAVVAAEALVDSVGAAEVGEDQAEAGKNFNTKKRPS